MCRDLRPGGPTSLVRRAAFVALNRWALSDLRSLISGGLMFFVTHLGPFGGGQT
jgi:hypothetical protein